MTDHGDCHVTPTDKPLEEGALRGASAAFLAVEGLGCERCAARVRNGLLALDGVLLADVFLDEGAAAVAYDPAAVDASRLLDAVTGSGNDGRHTYRARLLTVEPVANVLDQGGLIWSFSPRA